MSDSKIEVKNIDDKPGLFCNARKLRNKTKQTNKQNQMLFFIITTNQANQLITVMLSATKYLY